MCKKRGEVGSNNGLNGVPKHTSPRAKDIVTNFVLPGKQMAKEIEENRRTTHAVDVSVSSFLSYSRSIPNVRGLA